MSQAGTTERRPVFYNTSNGKSTRGKNPKKALQENPPGITFFWILTTVPSESAWFSNSDIKTNGKTNVFFYGTYFQIKTAINIMKMYSKTNSIIRPSKKICSNYNGFSILQPWQIWTESLKYQLNSIENQSIENVRFTIKCCIYN